MTITSLVELEARFLPIINYPEVAIFGVASHRKNKFTDGKFDTRIMPISLSYDHRIIDGAEATRFNNDLEEIW